MKRLRSQVDEYEQKNILEIMRERDEVLTTRAELRRLQSDPGHIKISGINLKMEKMRKAVDALPKINARVRVAVDDYLASRQSIGGAAGGTPYKGGTPGGAGTPGAVGTPGAPPLDVPYREPHPADDRRAGGGRRGAEIGGEGAREEQKARAAERPRSAAAAPRSVGAPRSGATLTPRARRRRAASASRLRPRRRLRQRACPARRRMRRDGGGRLGYERCDGSEGGTARSTARRRRQLRASRRAVRELSAPTATPPGAARPDAAARLA